MVPVFALHLFDPHQFIYIFTSIYPFACERSTVVAIQHQIHIGVGMAAVRPCARTFAIDIERLSCCHAHLHS